MSQHHTIDYIEFQVKDIAQTKEFFARVFGWQFEDYGPEYCAVTNAAVPAGFYQSDATMLSEKGSALIVLYSDDLEKSRQKILDNGGQIIKPIFSFPGGRRFHFSDPNNNEYAVWSE